MQTDLNCTSFVLHPISENKRGTVVELILCWSARFWQEKTEISDKKKPDPLSLCQSEILHRVFLCNCRRSSVMRSWSSSLNYKIAFHCLPLSSSLFLCSSSSMHSFLLLNSLIIFSLFLSFPNSPYFVFFVRLSRFLHFLHHRFLFRSCSASLFLFPLSFSLSFYLL